MVNENTKILVVDDSAFMRQFIIGYLHEAGYEKISEAANGQVALDLCELEPFDIIILDLIMPVLGGIEVIERLAPKKANIIVTSAVGQQPMIDRSMALGAKGYFVKPFFDAKEFSAKIEEILHGSE